MSHTTGTETMDSEELVVALAWKMAARKGIDPMMCAPLYNSVDPDIIECLPDCADGTTVTFEWCGKTVTLQGDMSVEITAD